MTGAHNDEVILDSAHNIEPRDHPHGERVAFSGDELDGWLNKP